MSSIVPAHFPNQISVPSAEKAEACIENVGLPMLKKYNYDVRWPFTHLLSACLLSCNRVAASRMQIVPEWLPVACKLYPRGCQSHANFRWFIHVACDWWPCEHNLHAGGHLGTNYMRLAASRMRFCSIWTEKWRRHLKIWKSTWLMCLLRPIHKHYAWSDPISWDSSFKGKLFCFKFQQTISALFGPKRCNRYLLFKARK